MKMKRTLKGYPGSFAKIHRAKVVIPRHKADFYRKLLKACKMDDQTAPDGVIETFTARFRNGFQADIKVCNAETSGGGPWVDPVLFDEGGNEVSVIEPGDSLLGKYYWEVDGEAYVAVVEARLPCVPV
jgi:hypothetical protein